MSQPIRFFHRGEIVTLAPAEWPEPTRSVLDWLRTGAGCTGTKEGCNEGDCGACTVAVGELAEPGDPQAVDGLRWRTVNACLQFLPTLDGRALMTVEDLSASPLGDDPEAPLHPVQQAMVDAHASQCGFCTPGFVMSLWHLYEHHLYEQRLGAGHSHAHTDAHTAAPDRQTVADALAGNLCRCTGYRPILDAAQRMFELPPRRLDAYPIVQALQAIATARQADAADAAQAHPGWLAPRSLEAFAAARLAHPEATLLAGSTDIGLWVNKQFRPLGMLLYIGQVAELKRIETLSLEGEAWLHIGAAVSHEAAWAALCEHWPDLAELWRRFASPPVRHAGTLVGNLANGSPIGDGAPALMALDAVLELRRGDAVRALTLPDFYLGYMRNALQPGEFVQAVRVPLALQTSPMSPNGLRRAVRAYKISKRFDCDISAVCLGARVDLDAGGSITAARLAFGGMAATVKRAAGAEAALTGQPWTEATLRAAQVALSTDFEPLTDLRGSAGYRRRVAEGLLERLWLQTRPEAPLAERHTRVWALELE